MRTLKKLIVASKINSKDWTKDLHAFLLAYRSTPHRATNASPFELLFKRKVRATCYLRFPTRATKTAPTSRRDKPMRRGRDTTRHMLANDAAQKVTTSCRLHLCPASNNSKTSLSHSTTRGPSRSSQFIDPVIKPLQTEKVVH